MNRVAKSLGYFPELLQSPQRPREECLFFDLQKQGEFVRKLSVEGEEGERGRGERGGRGARGEVDYEERLNENGEVLEMILKGIEERFFFIGLTERFFFLFFFFNLTLFFAFCSVFFLFSQLLTNLISILFLFSFLFYLYIFFIFLPGTKNP